MHTASAPFLRLVFCLLWMLCLCAARAQTADEPAVQVHWPARVGWLSWAGATVDAAYAQDGLVWQPHMPNRPLTSGDRVATGSSRNAQAEIIIGSSTLWLDAMTGVSFPVIGDDTVVLELSHGTAALQVEQLFAAAHWEIRTPNIAVTLNRPGHYRLDVDTPRGETRLAVLSGSVTVYGHDVPPATMVSGMQAVFSGTRLAESPVSVRVQRDSFDAWSEARAREQARLDSHRHVAPEVTGLQVLDAFGSWSCEPSRECMWFPATVPSQWAPFRQGAWLWIEPWGWTWIDDQPWGFATSHYGRWTQAPSGRWAWVPGPKDVRPVYAPALVGFTATDSGSTGDDALIGWYPLAPGEIWYPPVVVSISYWNHVNYFWRPFHRHPPHGYRPHHWEHGSSALPGGSFARLPAWRPGGATRPDGQNRPARPGSFERPIAHRPAAIIAAPGKPPPPPQGIRPPGERPAAIRPGMDDQTPPASTAPSPPGHGTTLRPQPLPHPAAGSESPPPAGAAGPPSGARVPSYTPRPATDSHAEKPAAPSRPASGINRPAAPSGTPRARPQVIETGGTDAIPPAANLPSRPAQPQQDATRANGQSAPHGLQKPPAARADNNTAEPPRRPGHTAQQPATRRPAGRTDENAASGRR